MDLLLSILEEYGGLLIIAFIFYRVVKGMNAKKRENNITSVSNVSKQTNTKSNDWANAATESIKPKLKYQAAPNDRIAVTSDHPELLKLKKLHAEGYLTDVDYIEYIERFQIRSQRQDHYYNYDRND